MEFNYKMEIGFKSGISDKLEKAMVNKITELAESRGFKAVYKDCLITIEGTGRDNDFASMGVVLCALKDTDWFLNNVTYWYFYDSEGGAEDLVQKFHLR